MIAKAASDRGKKTRIRFKGRGVCGEGTRDEEEEGEASSPLWMTFWQQGLMVSTRKIEIFQVIQGWPHFSLLFALTLSLSIIKRLSVGIKQSPWGSSCVCPQRSELLLEAEGHSRSVACQGALYL